MVLNEAKLRSVIREELEQYLIEQGFLQKIGSGIKSAYQKLTGGGQTSTTQPATTQAQTTPTTPTQQTSAASTTNSQADVETYKKLFSYVSRQNARSYGYLIQNSTDIDKAINYYKELLKQPQGGNQALIQIFSNLTASINHRQAAGLPKINAKVLNRYKVFVDDIKNSLNKQNIKEEVDFKKHIEQRRKELKTIIPYNIIYIYLDKIEDFIFDNKLLNLMGDPKVKEYFGILIKIIDSQYSQPQQQPQEEQSVGKENNIQERKNIKRRK